MNSSATHLQRHTPATTVATVFVPDAGDLAKAAREDGLVAIARLGLKGPSGDVYTLICSLTCKAARSS